MIQTREILAAAYKGRRVSQRVLLSHAVMLDNVGRPLRVLCGRVQLHSLADEWASEPTLPPTCPRCLAALTARAKAGR